MRFCPPPPPSFLPPPLWRSLENDENGDYSECHSLPKGGVFAILKPGCPQNRLCLKLFFPRDLVAHDCGYPLSRYTCRATRVAADFLDFIAFCRCSTGVALHPLKILVSHLPPLCREVSHRILGLKRCRATRGCRSYSCGCRATLCN